MTEAQWLACENPLEPLELVAPRSTDRKLRLFLCHCCARVVDAVPPQRRLFRGYYAGSFQQLQRALSVVEQFAEGLVGSDALAKARRDAADSAYVPGEIDYGGETPFGSEVAAAVAAAAARPVPKEVLETCWRATNSQTARATGGQGNPSTEEAQWQVLILRDIFGNPFHSVTLSPEWRTSTAVALAAQMYESRDFSALPILADALQDAGCDSADILNHCRGKGPHVRGCWVVDLVLGKE